MREAPPFVVVGSGAASLEAGSEPERAPAEQESTIGPWCAALGEGFGE